MKTVVIFGGQGQLGAQLTQSLAQAGWTIFAPSRGEVDLLDFECVAQLLRSAQPTVVLNCAAVHDLNLCHEQPEIAFRVNALAAGRLAELADEVGAYLVYVSTDYVFEGNSNVPYIETDRTGPLNVYGQSKLAGETRTLQAAESAAALRISAIYGSSPCRGKSGPNFVERMINSARAKQPLRVVDDEYVSPTSTEAIARQLLVLLQSRPTGVIHATSQGMCSWYQFAVAILAEARIDWHVEPVSSGTFPSTVVRPKFSVLENAALSALGLDLMPPWEEGLHDYLTARTS